MNNKPNGTLPAESFSTSSADAPTEQCVDQKLCAGQRDAAVAQQAGELTREPTHDQCAEARDRDDAAELAGDIDGGGRQARARLREGVERGGDDGRGGQADPDAADRQQHDELGVVETACKAHPEQSQAGGSGGQTGDHRRHGTPRAGPASGQRRGHDQRDGQRQQSKGGRQRRAFLHELQEQRDEDQQHEDGERGGKGADSGPDETS